MALFQELNAQGITLIIVSHEPDVAMYAKRVVEVRDGKIIHDDAVKERHDAAADLLALGKLDPVVVSASAPVAVGAA
jgi:putative ABC transport system ATP-binding protein